MGRESRVDRVVPKSLKPKREVQIWTRENVEYLPTIMRAMGTKRPKKVKPKKEVPSVEDI